MIVTTYINSSLIIFYSLNKPTLQTIKLELLAVPRDYATNACVS